MKGELSGRKALVTAGPTYEPIDPVRFIGNRSTGTMGLAIAKELQNRGAEVTLVLGPSSLDAQGNGILVKRVNTAGEMYEECQNLFHKMDIAVMAAAVSDYAAESVSGTKIKKTTDTLNLELKKTRDILGSLGKIKKPGQVLVGFALETNDERDNALQKLEKKNADLIVLNSLQDEGAGPGSDTNKITIFEKNGKETAFGKKSKSEVAKDIVDTIIRNYYA